MNLFKKKKKKKEKKKKIIIKIYIQKKINKK